MKEFLQQLFDYNYQSNKQLMKFCSELDAIPEKTELLYSHILNAHHLWNCRIEGVSPKFGVWDRHELGNWEEIHEDNQRYTFSVLSGLENFSKLVSYESTEGNSYTNTVQDILYHIVNHSTHHRAQIAVDLRNEGITPLELDYIKFRR